MIQRNTWHDYAKELKHFLCDVAKSRWARFLFYPLGVFVAIMSWQARLEHTHIRSSVTYAILLVVLLSSFYVLWLF